VTFLGYEVANTLLTGGNLPKMVPTTDPLRQALADHGSSGGRSSWDPLLTALACIGDPVAAGYTTVRGTGTVDSAGANTFATSATGPHEYVVKAKTDTEFQTDINTLLVPGRQPVPPTGLQVKGSDGVARPAERTARLLGNSIQIQAPAAATGLRLLAEMNAASQSLADGTAVAAWPAGGGTRSWAQATGSKQPVYRTNVGGLACHQFSGAQFLATVGNITSGTTGVTVLAKVRWTTLPTAAQTVVAADAGNTTRWFHLKGNSGGIAQAASFVGNTGTADSSPTGLTVNTWQVIAARLDPSASVEALLGTSTNGVTATSGANTGNTDVHLGVALTGTMTEPLNNAYVAKVQVWEGKANDTELAALVAAM
jgi:hypothetical protein